MERKRAALRRVKTYFPPAPIPKSPAAERKAEKEEEEEEKEKVEEEETERKARKGKAGRRKNRAAPMDPKPQVRPPCVKRTIHYGPEQKKKQRKKKPRNLSLSHEQRSE